MLLAACGGDAGDTPPPAETTPATQPAAEPPAATPEPAAAAPATAPATYRVRFETSEGDFVVEVNRSQAPNGADRFYQLVSDGFYTDVRFFRVISGFMAQVGIHGNPTIAKAWMGARIQDDPVKQSNRRGFVSFATAGANTRTTQIFINFGDNVALDKMGFAPFGEVTNGMGVVDKLYSGYGEGAPSGKGPDQQRVQGEGNAYLNKEFSRLDFIKAATIGK
jgi:peptidyl-prolyl cis-trans isomerase A (cyclophilin A)